MSKLQFETELKQLQGEFLSFYNKMHQLCLRHGDVAPHAGPKIMPHLEMAKKGIEQIVEKPAHLIDPGD